MNHEPISRATQIGENGERRKDVGSLLRASRLRCGEELEDVAQILRIRRRHLQAIEDGEFASLPGVTYAVGFIRAYADYLGLDSEEVVRRFKETKAPDAGPANRKSDLVFPSPMSDSGVPRGALVFLGVIVGVIAYGTWYTSTVDNSFFKQWIEPVPARLAGLIPGSSPQSSPAETQPVPPSSASEPMPAAAPQPAPEPAQAPSEVPAAEPVAAASAVDSASNDPANAPAAMTQASDTPDTVAAAASEATPITSEAAQAPASEGQSVQESAQATAQVAVRETPEAAASSVVEAAESSGATPETAVQPAQVAAAETAPPAEVSPSASADRPAEQANEPTAPVTPGPVPVQTGQSPAASAPAAPAAGPEPAPETAQGTTSPPAAETAAAPADAAPQEAATPVETDAATRIVITALSDSWVEIRELGTDAWVWGKLLRQGETYAVPDRDDLKMKTGNAGGLAITVDGKSVPPVGASGDVVRNVLMDPERLKDGKAVFR